MPLFLDTEAILVVRQILLLMLCRNERKRAVLKQDDGYLVVEPVPEDISHGQVLVTFAKDVDEALEPVFPVEGFAFIGLEIMF